MAKKLIKDTYRIEEDRPLAPYVPVVVQPQQKQQSWLDKAQSQLATVGSGVSPAKQTSTWSPKTDPNMVGVTQTATNPTADVNPTLWNAALAATEPPAGAQPAETPAAAAETEPVKNSVEYWQNQLYDYGKFTDPYQRGINQKYNAIVERKPFSYDLESDPQWAAYKAQYTRAGQRAYDDALARLSARTGGLASSYAGGVAAQQYGDYMRQMTDRIPELYKLAYDMYANEHNMDLSDLNAIRGLSGDAYGRWSDDFNRLGTLYDVARGERSYADTLSDKAREDQLAYAKLLANMGDYSALDAYYGGTGLSDAYAAQQAAKQAYRGSISSTPVSPEKPDLTVAQVNTAIKNGTITDKVKEAYEYYYGEPYSEPVSDESNTPSKNAFERAYDAGVTDPADAWLWAVENGLGSVADDFSAYYDPSRYVKPGLSKVSSGASAGTSLDYSPDEGIFVWNGKTYNSPGALLTAINALNDSDVEAEMKKKLARYGFDLL